MRGVSVSHAKLRTSSALRSHVMGNCTSVVSAPSKSELRRGVARWYSTTSPPSTAKVICVDGRVKEYEAAVPAGHVAAMTLGYCVFCGDEMEVGARSPVVAEGEELQPGQLYFLLPVSYSRHPLSLPDLCHFAAKASTALRHCH